MKLEIENTNLANYEAPPCDTLFISNINRYIMWLCVVITPLTNASHPQLQPQPLTYIIHHLDNQTTATITCSCQKGMITLWY